MDRKAAGRQHRDRPADAGIYAARFVAGTWVGAAPRLAAAENRLRFMLSIGNARNPGLERAFRDEGAFRFEVLEAFPADISAMTRQRLLKERLAHWLEATGGCPVVP